MKRIQSLAWAVGGASLVGLIAGFPEGPEAMIIRMLEFPAVLVGVPLLMFPPLYVGTAALGFAPPAGDCLAAASEGFESAGRVLAGFAAPLAFLVATTSLWATVWVLTHLVVGLAALLAVRVVWYSLFASIHPRPMPLYLLWVAVGFSIGEHLAFASFG